MYTLGSALRFTLFGESHSECVGGILEGVPKGTAIDEKAIERDMSLRKPSAGIGTPRKEDDRVEFTEGVCDGMTDGGPIRFIIRNKNTDSSKYAKFNVTPRPGHADLPALFKFKGHEIKGGNQFSGRLTAPMVAAGSIAKQHLLTHGVEVHAFARSIGPVADPEERTVLDAKASENYPTRACGAELNERMSAAILSAAADGDSVGGVVECIAVGLPIGFGGIWFEALDSEIAKAVFSIPACKGVEFGKGFALAGMRGSESNDPFFFDGGIRTKTNNMGGILGGMSDGAPLVFRAVFKPTPSIGKEQDTVNLREMRNDKVAVEGRHDPCIVPRAASVVEAAAALVIADQMMREYQ
ncbi:MAG: chorismate synthase [Candidatus Methanoplasma sp.]|jgi:chorismate synthase|nr:chorismate synthase [Candidatus Methanoplasma sp.]